MLMASNWCPAYASPYGGRGFERSLTVSTGNVGQTVGGSSVVDGFDLASRESSRHLVIESVSCRASRRGCLGG